MATKWLTSSLTEPALESLFFPSVSVNRMLGPLIPGESQAVRELIELPPGQIDERLLPSATATMLNAVASPRAFYVPFAVYYVENRV